MADAHAEASKLHTAVINERTKLVAFADAEETRARNIATKLKALIS